MVREVVLMIKTGVMIGAPKLNASLSGERQMLSLDGRWKSGG